MDSVYAIVAGLGLRFVVDTVSRHDFKITSTLIGLWEGVILLHFLKKLPKSTDPYVAFAVRLFIDFVVTESIARLVLVLTWTGMGMILADVAPAIWEDTGLRRIWSRFRRDLYIISESIPTVVFFPPTRTVRFSPSREPSVIEAEGAPDATEAPSVVSSTSAAMTEQETPANVQPTSIRRRLPGYFPGTLSDTESVLSSVIGGNIRLPSTFQPDPERTSRRLSVYPTHADDLDFASETSSQQNEVDDDIKSPSSSSSRSTVTGDPADTTRFTDDIQITEDFDTTQLTDIPDEEDLEEKKPEKVIEDIITKLPLEGETTPKQPNVPILLPPTPSDSQAPRGRRLPKDNYVRPLSPSIPQIPDMPEDVPSDGPSDGWENIQKEDASDAEMPWEQVQREDVVDADKPPPLPPKDWSDMNLLFSTTPTNVNDPVGLYEINTDEHRQSQPPPYDLLDDHDDIYEDHPSNIKALEAILGGSNAGPDLATPGNKQQVEEEINKHREEEEKRLEEEAAKKRQEEERKRVEEEINKQREEEEKRLAQEALKKRQEEEAAEKKRIEEEQRLEAAAAAAELRRQEEEAAAAEMRILAEEAAATKKRLEEEAAAAELRRLAEAKRSEEEAEKKRLDAERQRKQEEEERLAVEKKRKEEEAEKERQRLEAEKKQMEEEEKRKLDEEEASRKRLAEEAEEAGTAHKEEEGKRLKEQAATEQRKLEEERKAKATETKHSEEEVEKVEVETATQPMEEETGHQQSEEEVADEAGTQPQQATTVLVPSSSAPAETQGTDEQQNPVNEDVPISEELGNEDPEDEDQHRMESESVVTEQSAVPDDVEDRLSRILTTKAQIVELQSVVDELETQLEGAEGEKRDAVEHDYQHAKKILEKMQKKEQRRRDNGSFLSFSSEIET